MLLSWSLFALPGIAFLIVFILARPQEAIPLLQRVPFLHLFTALAVIGFVIDIRLRRLQPTATNTLPWVICLVLLGIISTAINAPNDLTPRVIELSILFCLYGTIAHGIQRFRTFSAIAGVLCATCLFITFVCAHQGLSAKQCIGGEEAEGAIEGKPDGRLCETSEDCRGPDADPTLEYRCEYVGLLGTYSVEERVRYRGDLQDPNECALTICAGGMALLIGFALRKKGAGRLAMYAGVALVVYTVFRTESRGGLVAAMLVPGVFLLRRYGLKIAIPAMMVAVPVMMLGGRHDEAAEVSTAMRYDAWSAGIDMWHHSPVYGIGARQFGDNFWLAAHNSYLLSLAELGLTGLILLLTIVFLCFKTLLVGMRELRTLPGTQTPVIWGMALLAAFSGIVFQINTLSFLYHPVLWIFFGLIGAWYSAVRHHKPDLVIKVTLRDFAGIVIAAIAYATVVLPLFLKVKGFR
jgi:hypothetical protein